jgi:hypothetical protein
MTRDKSCQGSPQGDEEWNTQGLWSRHEPNNCEKEVLEENAWANPDARICPLTHASVDWARQAESVGRNSSFSILIAIRRSPNL